MRWFTIISFVFVFAISHNVLRFGEFKTKAGRLSPYFFNAGLFNDGDSLRKIGQFYAKAILAAQLPFDMLFGPAYKGIPLVSAVSISLSEIGSNYPFCFNRKEAKDHGEGGSIVGLPLSGRVLIVDDVISAGVSVRETVDLIRASDAIPCGVIIALDRIRSTVSRTDTPAEMMAILCVRLDNFTRKLFSPPSFRLTCCLVRHTRVFHWLVPFPSLCLR